MINTLTTRQECQIVILKPEKELVIPDLMMKKKSKSIDSRKTEHHHYHSSENKLKKSARIPPKKSIDLTM